MGRKVTITLECDRCSSGFHSEQVDVDTYARMKEIEDVPEDEVLFLCRTGGKEVKYNLLCDGCKAVLSGLLDKAGPIQRRQKGMGKKKSKVTKKSKKGAVAKEKEEAVTTTA